MIFSLKLKPSVQKRDNFYYAAPHQARTRGQGREVKGRVRLNMGAVKCARENVVQDKNIRFVNTTHRFGSIALG